MEDVNTRRRILKKSTPGKFAYTCHFQQIGINKLKIEKTGIHFKTDIFAAVVVVDAKAPYLLTCGVLEKLLTNVLQCVRVFLHLPF